MITMHNIATVNIMSSFNGVNKNIGIICCFIIPSSNLLITGTTWMIYSRGLATIMSFPALYLLFGSNMKTSYRISLILFIILGINISGLPYGP